MDRNVGYYRLSDRIESEARRKKEICDMLALVPSADNAIYHPVSIKRLTLESAHSDYRMDGFKNLCWQRYKQRLIEAAICMHFTPGLADFLIEHLVFDESTTIRGHVRIEQGIILTIEYFGVDIYDRSSSFMLSRNNNSDTLVWLGDDSGDCFDADLIECVKQLLAE